ncbi:DUF4251 domain-containing protein [uncultured Bacteroides sp.]|uniref:DUF4251 domain-containing protein n=1 Tax=uncultured Bacteroides sp. TaxID=162156 RepID=UPI0025DF3D17|nr:DUF4251 domain-containing protein [uncultured Bacteroides sp.]
MRKFIAFVAFVLISASTMMYAQESNAATRRSDRKAQRDAERAKFRAEEQVQDMASYQQAVQALKNREFVLEANQVIFRNGMTAFVTSNTNFVLMNGNKATVQTAFNTPYPGPNGIGGVTVDGNSSDMKMDVDKKGNVKCSFSVQGIGISAQVFITMSNGSNSASVTISPNFNSNNLTLNGNIVPLEQSNIFKGRSW